MATFRKAATLLAIIVLLLTCKISKVDGTLRLRGSKSKEEVDLDASQLGGPAGEPGDISDHKSIIGFVPQDDIVHEGLTVGEQIGFAAELRNPVELDHRHKRLIAEDVLNVMQIEHIQNSIVGGVEERGISGGQRKRVNIGLELASNPTVLFLDEPTSGLDATSSLTIVHSLKKMTQLGMTCVMVIHQPRYSLFTLFDDVLLLGKGGRTVYLGPSVGAKDYFEFLGFEMPKDENPADWFMDVISGEVKCSLSQNFQPVMLFDLWVKNKDHFRATESPKVQKRAWTQEDDRAALNGQLEQEWDKIDSDGNGVMDQGELQQLLTQCTNSEPRPDVVRELIHRMAGPDQDQVTKEEFLEFLVGLQGVVAADKNLGMGGESESDSDMGAFGALLDGESGARSLTVGKEDSDEGGPGIDRNLPGFFRQLGILFHRNLVQWWRRNKQRGIFLGVIVVAAIVLGYMDKVITEEPQWSAEPFLNLHTCLALLMSVFCLGVFGRDRPVFWRESASGMHVLAFFLARVLTNAFDLVLQCFLFAAVYYLIRQPELHFKLWFQPFLLVTFAASGVGYLISAILPPQHGPFIAALVSFVSCGLLGHPQRVHKLADGGFMEATTDFLSITRWSVGMAFLKNLDETAPEPKTLLESQTIKNIQKIYRDEPMWQDTFGYWATGTYFLLGMGIFSYIGAYLGLKFTNRDKQV
eukprot:TRINITY_DN23485_c0_g2_i4.p1 TRINITY_DN23485_c0_g2~~TRINITY_DN23485_c0_g2_i4.p1  ORF type:complete len:695 (+),score=205.19 TRINITY_DN23485_c0_g2_i4:274-2358(+)